MTELYSQAEMCASLGKSAPYIRNLQSQLKLYVAKRQERYPEAYVYFMRKVVALRTFNVALDDISELLAKEIKIQELLHFDAIHDGPLWYLGPGANPVHSDSHLLLTGRDLGAPIAADAIQGNLDFRERTPELFGRREMGEDVRHVIQLYLKCLRRIDARVRAERPVLLEALDWAGRGLMPKQG